MKITGSVEEIIYRNETNGYSVIVLDCNCEIITCVGKFPSLTEGQVVEATGSFIKDRKYGEQFKTEKVKVLPPKTIDGIVRYLGSGLIKGIGPVTALNIVNKFKTETLDIIELNPQRLTEVRGVSPTKALQIHEAYSNLKKMQDTIIFLQSYDISTNLAVKIYNLYEDKTEELLLENPYRLIEDVDGIGFLTADKIAQKLGIKSDSEFRLRAGVLHVLKENSDKNGNTYIPKSKLFASTLICLKLDEDTLNSQFDNILFNLSLENIVTIIEEESETNIMLTKFFVMENSIAKKIIALKNTFSSETFNPENEIEQYEIQNKIKLHDKQKEAVISSINSGFSVITGGPGTGKTTIVKCLLHLLKLKNKKFCLLAPTGRAAKRLNESTGEEAKTIHRALELNFKEGSTSVFAKNEQNPILADAIIIDEVSMVDVVIFYSLLKAIRKGTQVIIVGDKDQLPSVSAGNVLGDILNSGTINTVMLTEIYRQDSKSLIITNAHAINNGKMPILDNTSSDFFFENKLDAVEISRTIIDLQVNRLPKYLNIEPNKIQVLAPMKIAVCGVDNLNKELQAKINPPSDLKPEIVTESCIFRLNDKVMQTVNNYEMLWTRQINYFVEDGVGVFNGDIGIIEGVNLSQMEVTVLFEDGRRAVYPKSELNQLVLSYAITIHKSQGSEFDVVIMPIIAGPPSILTRNLLYTGVTRAKKMVVLVGGKYNLKRMIDNNYQTTRYSYLKKFLIAENDKFNMVYGN